MKIYIVFPCLRIAGVKNLGKFRIKTTFEHFKKEPRTVREELIRIASFFTQREARPLDDFSYVIIETTKEKVDTVLEKLKQSLEVYRFLAIDVEGRGRPLSYEHTVPYIVIPQGSKPYELDGKLLYSYDVYINFGKRSFHTTYSTGRKEKPSFNLDIYSDTPSYFDPKECKILLKKVKDKTVRALSWYNITYSSHLPSETDFLLKISVAFETLLKVNREKGKKDRLKELGKELKRKGLKRLTKRQKEVVISFLQEKLTSQLAEKIKKISGSTKLSKWFSQYFYSAGSTLRHGEEIDLLPVPRDADKHQSGSSLWYGEGASHHFLNNVYFGRRLFRFIFREKHFPAAKYLKEYEVRKLEDLLVSDESRLKKLEKYISTTEEGKLDWKELRICNDLGGSYSGDKKRIFILLQRFLKEIKVSFPKDWNKIESKAKILLEVDLGKVPLDDYEGFKPYYFALIDVDSVLDKRDGIYAEEKDFKLFNIKRFVSFSLHQLL